MTAGVVFGVGAARVIETRVGADTMVRHSGSAVMIENFVSEDTNQPSSFGGPAGESFSRSEGMKKRFLDDIGHDFR